MNFGDSVLYTENGKTYKATVLGSRIMDHHSGKDGEPLVQLAFFVDVPGVLGTARQGELVQWRVDVAHESHEYTDEHRAEAAKRGQHYPGIYGGGRWSEVDDEEPAYLLTPEARRLLTQSQLQGSRPAYPGSAESLATVTSTTGLTDLGSGSAEGLPEGIKPKVEDVVFTPGSVQTRPAMSDTFTVEHESETVAEGSSVSSADDGEKGTVN